MGRAIPNQANRTGKGKPDRQENPIGKLAPVDRLDTMKSVGPDQPPGAENVNLVRPDRPDVIERESQIQEKKGCSSQIGERPLFEKAYTVGIRISVISCSSGVVFGSFT